MIKPFKIGNVKIDNQLVLAPMYGVNCGAFRLMCKEYGAGLVYTQMIDCEKFVRMIDEEGVKKTVDSLINPLDEERPLAVQLIGIDGLSETVKVVSKFADIIDYNISCPLDEFVDRKLGAFLLKDMNIRKIINVLRDNSRRAISVKVRAGWNSSDKLVDFCKGLDVDAITVHGKTYSQGYGGKADWELIKKVKENVDCVVIGNGDISKPYNVVTRLGQSKCDGVMIGRTAMSNPYFFSQALELLDGKEKYDELSRKDMFKRFLELYKKHEKRFHLNEVKDHALWIAKGMKDQKGLKKKIISVKDAYDILDVLI